MPLRDERFGPYRLGELLGSGGMGEVYLAHDEHLDRQVAIKVIRTDLLLSSDTQYSQAALHLFKREAQAIARLSHPHILPLYAYDEITLGRVQLAYLVMPFCPDGSLGDWWQQHEHRGPLPLAHVVTLLQQAASALQCAHDHRVIHRDVKPANFLLQSSSSHSLVPDLLLADFGIAPIADATTSLSFAVRGTPLYMAPEQWSAQPTLATDQYALAIMIYQLLTGQHPFSGGATQMMYHHLHTPPSAPSRLEGSIPPALDAVILKALEKNPAERFSRIQQFAHAFEQGLGSERLTVASTTMQAQSPAPRPVPAEPSPQTPEQLSSDPTVPPIHMFEQQPATPSVPATVLANRSQPRPLPIESRTAPSGKRATGGAGRTRIQMVLLILALAVVLASVITWAYHASQDEAARVAAANALYQKTVHQPLEWCMLYAATLRLMGGRKTVAVSL
jgi:serine/threonine protein kinase